jgi:hypothetical protein
MRSSLPMFGMIVLGLVFVIGIIIFGSAMQSVYVETNMTAENMTLQPYMMQSAWWGGAAILAMIIGIAFAFYTLWR